MTNLDTTAPSHDNTQSVEDLKYTKNTKLKSHQFSAFYPRCLLVIHSALNLNTHIMKLLTFFVLISLLEFDL